MLRLLEPLGLATPAVAAEIAAALVPVVEHPALAAAAVHRMQVPRGAMGVAVDEARVTMRAQDRFNCR